MRCGTATQPAIIRRVLPPILAAGYPLADRRELPPPVGCGSLHDPLGSPVVNLR
jgi:hypothetical protein